MPPNASTIKRARCARRCGAVVERTRDNAAIRQAETGTWYSGSMPGFATVKAFENFFDVFFRYADAVVSDENNCIPLFLSK